MLVATMGAIAVNLAQLGWGWQRLHMGVLRALPLALFLSFCLVPNVSKTIFQSWSCIAYEFDGSDLNGISSQSYLINDLSVRCSEKGFKNPEHDQIKTIAYILMAIWPVGMVVLYAATLLPCGSSLKARELTPLNRATRFLHREYKLEWFAWELLELNRRTFLVGWVIFVFDTDHVFLRLLAALLLSISSFALLLSTHP